MDETTLNIEFGDSTHLTGNAFAYWQVEARSAESRSRKFVVSNFIVSPLLFNRHTIAATFPPVVYEDRDELFGLAERAGIDVIRMEDVTISEEDFDFARFFKRQLGRFNDVVTLYSRLYTETLLSGEPEKDAVTENDELAKLRQLSTLAEEARSAFIENRNKALGRDMVLKIRRIAHLLNSPNYKYDIENMIALLGIPDDRANRISGLYFHKFFAIHTEQYEEAERLKREIDTLARELDRENRP
jgi:hypothetical protein